MYPTRLASLFPALLLGVLLCGCAARTATQTVETVEATAILAWTATLPATDTQPAPTVAPSITPVRVTARTSTVTASPTAIPACPGSLPWRLTAGQKGKVSEDPPISNRVRSSPDENAEILGQISPGEMFTVLEGPICAGGLTWWRVRSLAQTLQGWTAEGDEKGYFVAPFYTPTPTATATTPPALTPLPGRSYAVPTATLAPQKPLLGSGYQVLLDDALKLVLYDVDKQVEILLGKRQGSSVPADWSFSPDGQRVIYKAIVPKLNDERLLITNLSSGDTLMLPYEPPFLNVAWHPSGTAVKVNDRLVNPITGELIANLFPWESIFASFSPDGSYLAVLRYASPSFSVTEILSDNQGQVTGAQNRMRAFTMVQKSLVQDIVFDSDATITSTTERDGGYPVVDAGGLISIAWSPRNDRIALLMNNSSGGDIYLINPDGSGLTNLTKGYTGQRKHIIQSYLAWSPDGSKIAFYTLDQAEQANTLTNPHSFVVDAQTGRINDVSGTNEFEGSYPFWSPDSQWVIYQGPGHVLFASRADGSQTAPAFGYRNAYFGGFRPGPGGQPVVVSETQIRTPMPPPSSVLDLGQPTPTPAGLLADTLLYAQWPEESGGGTDIFNNRPTLNLVDSSGKTISQFSPRHNEPIFYWAWSPDRQKIAYLDGFLDLYVAKYDGSGEKKYTVDAPEAVKWSPDSSMLAYMSFDGLSVLSLSTGADVLVGPLERTMNMAWDWSPDGLRIAVLGDRLTIFNLKDGTRQDVTDAPNHGKAWTGVIGVDFLDWSPDSSRLVFVKEQGLWMVNADGSGLEEISNCKAEYVWPQWSPDGRNIAYLSNCKEGGYSLYFIAGNGQGDPRKITSGISAMYGMDWSPDGQSIAWVSDAFPFLTKPIFRSSIARETPGEPITDEKVPASHPIWTP